VTEVKEQNTVVVNYEPNEKQRLFHASEATEVVYGGAKGGGKSCALVMEALAYALEFPGSTIYMFRETYDDLESNLIKEWKLRVPSEIYKYNGTKYIASLYNGSKVFFRYVRDQKDAEQYDGRSIDAIFIDELTKHEEKAVQQILSCLRSPMGFPPIFRGSCNPGSIGHNWVKKRYIEPTNYGKKTYKDKLTDNTIAFVPATVYDNEAIMMNDPAYVRRLENLPPKKKQAFLHGDWDVYEGQAFEEFSEDIHVIEPFDIPLHWHRWLGVDNGYSDPFAWYWFAVDEEGFVYIYREFTREPKEPKLTYTDQAKRVLELSQQVVVTQSGARKVQEPIGVVFAGHDAFATHPLAPGKTIAYYYQQAGLHPILSSIPDRHLRKAVWHEYLRPFEYDGKMVAKVRIFNTCEKLIETLPQQPEDEKDAEKVELTNFDHWYDGSGYGLVSYHMSESEHVFKSPVKTLPWALQTEDDFKTAGSKDPYGNW